MASSLSLDQFNPFDARIQQCPFPYYQAMREQTPVFHVEGTDLYLITRHELITPILRDTATFSNRFGNAGEPPKGEVVERLRTVEATGWPRVNTMLTIDPPEHTRFRGAVAPYFTPRRIAELRPVVVEICERLVDSWIDSGRIEFVEAFAIPLPIEAIAAVLNVPAERRADFKRWSDDSIATIGALISDDRRVEAARGIVEFQHYFAAELEARRLQPKGDLMSDLVAAQIDTDEAGVKRALTMAEMLSIVQQLLVAGNETTTKALTEGVRLFAEHPSEWVRLCSDPAGRAITVVEEILRLATPTQGMFRLVTRDVEIAGCPVPMGSRLVLVYAAANRDDSVFDDPDSFRPDRENLKDHLAFGKGIHFCIGAPLSRLEMQVAFETLARRLETVTLAPDNELEYHPSFVLRGLKQLNVEFTKASGA